MCKMPALKFSQDFHLSSSYILLYYCLDCFTYARSCSNLKKFIFEFCRMQNCITRCQIRSFIFLFLQVSLSVAIKLYCPLFLTNHYYCLLDFVSNHFADLSNSKPYRYLSSNLQQLLHSCLSFLNV